MADSFDPKEFQGRLQRLDALLQEVERWSDPEAQAQVRAIVQAVLDLHGAGLERILDHLAAAGESAASEDIREQCDVRVYMTKIAICGTRPRIARLKFPPAR